MFASIPPDAGSRRRLRHGRRHLRVGHGSSLRAAWTAPSTARSSSTSTAAGSPSATSPPTTVRPRAGCAPPSSCPWCRSSTGWPRSIRSRRPPTMRGRRSPGRRMRLNGGGLILAGDSAGANLAAVTARRAAAEGIDVDHQLLVYPCLDPARSLASHRDSGHRHRVPVVGRHGVVLAAVPRRWIRASRTADERVDPRRAEVPVGLAPATVVVAGRDPLHDEGVAYALQLRSAGVEVTLLDFPDLFHGFAGFAGVERGVPSRLRRRRRRGDGGDRIVDEPADDLAGAVPRSAGHGVGTARLALVRPRDVRLRPQEVGGQLARLLLLVTGTEPDLRRAAEVGEASAW